jgi:hypothetical protein
MNILFPHCYSLATDPDEFDSGDKNGYAKTGGSVALHTAAWFDFMERDV